MPDQTLNLDQNYIRLVNSYISIANDLRDDGNMAARVRKAERELEAERAARDEAEGMRRVAESKVSSLTDKLEHKDLDIAKLCEQAKEYREKIEESEARFKEMQDSLEWKRSEVARLTDENRRMAQRMEEMVSKQQVSDGPSFDAELRRWENAPLQTPATPTFEELFKLRAFRRDVLDMAFASGVAFCGKGLKLELNAVSLAIRCNPAGNDEFQRRCDEIDRMRKFKGINGDLKGIVYDERDVDIYNYVSSEDVWL